MTRSGRDATRAEATTSAKNWHLLIHQIPARPIYLRARIGARLARTGAVALKNSVYVLAARAGALERLAPVAAEIREGGGEAFLCEARFEPADEQRLVESFRRARRDEYAELTAAADALLGSGSRQPRMSPAAIRARVPGLRRQLEWIASVDDFGATGRREAAAALLRLEKRTAARAGSASDPTPELSPWQGRTWVTRSGVQVDRIACAWFIRRFLDPAARIRFTAPGRGLRAGELGFDIPGAPFSHEEGRCSLEVLIARTSRGDPALRRIAEIVHDLDLQDGAYRHPEAPGIEQLIAGLVAAHADDDRRLERGAMLLDDLYRSFRRKPVINFPRPSAPPERR